MSVTQAEAFEPIGARLGKVAAIPVTTSSVIIDLSTYTNIYADLQAGRLLLADADGADVYYAWNSENSGTIATSSGVGNQATACARIPAGALVPMKPFYHTIKSKNSSGGAVTVEGACRYLLVIATVTCTLRLYVCSQATADRP